MIYPFILTYRINRFTIIANRTDRYYGSVDHFDFVFFKEFNVDITRLRICDDRINFTEISEMIEGDLPEFR